MKELKEMGFKVMLWGVSICKPIPKYIEHLTKRAIHAGSNRSNSNGTLVEWCKCTMLDLTNQESEKWFKQVLDGLIEDYGVDGFKLDAGDTRFYVGLKSKKEVSPNTHTELFAKIDWTILTMSIGQLGKWAENIWFSVCMTKITTGQI